MRPDRRPSGARRRWTRHRAGSPTVRTRRRQTSTTRVTRSTSTATIQHRRGFDDAAAYAAASGQGARAAQTPEPRPHHRSAASTWSARLEARSRSERAGRTAGSTTCTTCSDYANTLGQAFAAYALAERRFLRGGDATSFLLEQQCSDGWLPARVHRRLTRDQSCVDGTDAPTTDATAIAVLQLASHDGRPHRDASDREGAGLAGRRTERRRFLGRWHQHRGPPTPTAPGWPRSALGDTPPVREGGHGGSASHVRRPLRDRCTSSPSDGRDRLRQRRARRRTHERHHQRHCRTSGAAPPRRQLPACAGYLPEDTTPAAPSLTGPSGYLKAGHPWPTTEDLGRPLR